MKIKLLRYGKLTNFISNAKNKLANGPAAEIKATSYSVKFAYLKPTLLRLFSLKLNDSIAIKNICPNEPKLINIDNIIPIGTDFFNLVEKKFVK